MLYFEITEEVSETRTRTLAIDEDYLRELNHYLNEKIVDSEEICITEKEISEAYENSGDRKVKVKNYWGDVHEEYLYDMIREALIEDAWHCDYEVDWTDTYNSDYTLYSNGR